MVSWYLFGVSTPHFGGLIYAPDGRPDFLIESSDYRMEVSQSACLGHITNFMHPQAVIIDNSGVEDAFFLKAFKERAPALARTLIELPVNVDESLRWIARLDSASLKGIFLALQQHGPC